MAEAQFRLIFQWAVASEGYTWLSATPPGEQNEGLFLSTGAPTGSPVRMRRYSPFEETGMFRELAAARPDQDSIKAFADRYGLLGAAKMGTLLPLRDRPRESGFLTGSGERFSHWRHEIQRLQRSVELYDWTREGDLEALERFIVWEDDRVSYQSHPDWNGSQEIPTDRPIAFSTIASSDIHHDRLDRFERGDLIKPALFYIQKEINDRLNEETRLRLLWDPEEAELVNCAVPSSLLGAIWLQFALSVERGSSFRRCQECGKWFEVSPKTGRSDKLFCSTVCRVKAFRKRKAGGSVSLGADDGIVDDAGHDSPAAPDRKGPKSRKARRPAGSGG